MLITQGKTNIKYLFIAAILAVFAGGIMIGSYKMTDYYQKFSFQQIQSVKDETAGWKIYTNEKYGFEMKYPADWYYVVSDYDNQQLVCLNPEGISGDCDGLLTVSWDVGLQERYEAIKQLFKGYVISESDIKIDGRDGKLLTIENESGFSKELFFENEGYIYNFSILTGKEVIFNRMLSTFKLIRIDETADWLTYKDEEYGFEVKYPADFFQTESLGPKTKTVDCDYANFADECPFIPIEGLTGNEEDFVINQFIKTERMTINDLPFCLQKFSEGAMGTSYATYDYTTVRDKKCFVVYFTVGYPHCSNYLSSAPKSQERYNKCTLDNEVTTPETINKMLSTFKFINKNIEEDGVEDKILLDSFREIIDQYKFGDNYFYIKEDLIKNGWEPIIPEQYGSYILSDNPISEEFLEISSCGEGVDAICNADFQKMENGQKYYNHVNLQSKYSNEGSVIWFFVGTE
jgi:hypothetical protein